MKSFREIVKEKHKNLKQMIEKYTNNLEKQNLLEAFEDNDYKYIFTEFAKLKITDKMTKEELEDYGDIVSLFI